MAKKKGKKPVKRTTRSSTANDTKGSPAKEDAPPADAPPADAPPAAAVTQPWSALPPGYEPQFPPQPYEGAPPPMARDPMVQQVLDRRERKNTQSRTRAANRKLHMEEIQAKPESERTPEEAEELATYLDKRKRKNDRSRERALEKKSEIARILAKPEKKRTTNEVAFLDRELGRRNRKNEGDRLRRQRIKNEKVAARWGTDVDSVKSKAAKKQSGEAAAKMPPQVEPGAAGEISCSICHRPPQDPVTITLCSHTFCKTCLFSVFNLGVTKCPTCQYDLGPEPTKYALPTRTNGTGPEDSSDKACEGGKDAKKSGDDSGAVDKEEDGAVVGV